MGNEDELDIRSGGIVAVDTVTLRAAATDLRALMTGCEGVAADLARAGAILRQREVWSAPPTGAAAEAGERASRLATDLDTMADTYEIVELRAQALVAAASGDEISAQRIRAQIGDLLASNPELAGRVAKEAKRSWEHDVDALGRQYGLESILPGLQVLDGALPDEQWSAAMAAGLLGLVGGITGTKLTGLGVITRDDKLQGPPVPVTVTRTSTTSGTAPTKMTDLVDRVPSGSDTRVRVERYAMPDGSRQFVVYVSGTVGGDDEKEAWDWQSNLDNQFGRQSASQAAIRAALEDAGAQPGDVVNPVGYSQGGAGVSHLVVSGPYESDVMVTIGGPVQADVGPDTLNVALRHGDDPFSALSNGGFAAGSGAPGSIVVSRETPGTVFTEMFGDGFAAPHMLEKYRETAEMLDASGDPRMDAVYEKFDELDTAVGVEVFEYSAERVLPDPPAPHPDGLGVPGVPRVPGVPSFPLGTSSTPSSASTEGAG
ncbi:hypothetical protein [Microbacterium sp. bgisy203]|uniref:hypothetical protein n=1 Tax=Microbacterium sp. bgisy203 TaxID=3413799 RepID=UPI003D759B25